MATYKFDWLNSGAEIVDPELVVSSDNLSIYPSNMTIDVDIVLEITGGTAFGIRLTEVQVENFDYNETELVQRVITRLKDYEV